MNDGCAKFRNQIPMALLGDIGMEEKQALQSHLAECPPCAQEQELYAATLQHLQSYQEKSVPRHFFVYADDQRHSFGSLLRQISLGWRIAMAAGALTVILVMSLIAFNVQMRYEAGVLAIGFGRLPELKPASVSPAVDIEALKFGMAQILETRLRLEREEWTQSLKVEWGKFSAALDLRQQSLLQASLADLETRINSRILNTQAVLQTGNADGLDRLYQLIRTERQQDMVFVSDRLDQMARTTELANNQTDAILSTLLEVAELGIRNK